ncbi:MAG: glutathione S-transferase N-terminal domain-containing protein [Candidatus Methylopumilus sp.]
MKLLYSLTSPYARKVRIVAAEKRIAIDLELVVLSEPDCPVPQYNPLGKIPVLLMDDGESLYDSSVIVDYLDQRTPVSHLIPQDTKTKFQVKRWESLADGVCDAAVAVMLEQRRPEPMQDPAWIKKQWTKVELGLTALNDDLGQNKFCVANAFSLADIAVVCLLGYLNLRFGERLELATRYANLARLNEALASRPSIAETAPPTA